MPLISRRAPSESGDTLLSSRRNLSPHVVQVKLYSEQFVDEGQSPLDRIGKSAGRSFQ